MQIYEFKEYSSFIKNINSGIYRVTPEGNFIDINESFVELLEYEDKSEVLTKNFFKDICCEGKYSFLFEENKETSDIFEICLLKKSGERIWCEINSWEVKDEDDDLLYHEGIIKDITERKEIEGTLRREKKEYKSVFENTGTAMMLIKKNTVITQVNKKFEEITKYTREEVEGKMSWKKLVADREQQDKMMKYHNKRRRVNPEEPPPKHYEYKLVDKYGEIKDVMISVDVIPESKKTVASFIDITEKKKRERKIKYMNYHDELTGLYNKYYLRQSLAELNTPEYLPLSVITVDVNNLRGVNEFFGYKKGDELLKCIAKIIKKNCRNIDIPCRLGGDEFVIILPTIPKRTAEKIAEKIKKSGKECFSEEIETSISIGVSVKTEKNEDIFEIIFTAENSLYYNKLVNEENPRSGVINSLEKALMEKSHETEAHALRMKEMAFKLGKKLELSLNQLDKLELTAVLHDIGKIAVSDSVLSKSGSLNKEEWEEIKKHPKAGYRIVQSISGLASVAEGILYHHEKWDGSGYPEGLKGQEIPLISRIITIVDAYDVMTHERSYKDSLTKKEAIKELKKYAGIQFDPELIEKFLEIL